MLNFALAAIRARRGPVIGVVAAVALAVALLTASAGLMADALHQPGAGRFSRAAAVITASDTTQIGHGETASAVTVYPPPRLDIHDVSRIAALPAVAEAIPDLAFAISVVKQGVSLSSMGANRVEGHGWSSAALTPYRLVAGNAPTVGEVVLDDRLTPRVAVGQAVTIIAPSGVVTMRVSGLAAADLQHTLGQSAVFFADIDAARLSAASGKVNAVAVLKDATVPIQPFLATLRGRLGAGYAVYPRSRAAEADAGDPRAQQREDLIGYLGTLAAMAVVLAAFIITTTFALTTVQRRRELALLRVIGATPRQLRLLVGREALVLGAAGAVIGCLAGLALAAPLARALVRHGVAPVGLRADVNAAVILIATGAGLLVAVMSALTAVLRIARVRPSEALRASAVEHRATGALRTVLGAASLGGGIAMAVLFKGSLASDFAEVTALTLAIGVAFLAPTFLAAPARAVSQPLRIGAAGLLASAALGNERRRFGALGAGLVLIVALATSFTVSDATSRAAITAAANGRIEVQWIVLPGHEAGMPINAGARVRSIPGVQAAVGTMSLDVYLLDRGLDNFGSPWTAIAFDALVAGTLDLDYVGRPPARLLGNDVAISTTVANAHHVQVGDVIHARFADLTSSALRVAAIYRNSLGFGDIVVPRAMARADASEPSENTVYITATAPLTADAVHRVLPGAALVSRRVYLRDVAQTASSAVWPQWLLVLLIAVFAALSGLNASIVSAYDRKREFTLSRRIGATGAQLLRQSLLEAACITAVSVCVGGLCGATALVRLGQRPGWHIVADTTPTLAVLGSAAALGLVSSFLPQALISRRGGATA